MNTLSNGRDSHAEGKGEIVGKARCHTSITDRRAILKHKDISLGSTGNYNALVTDIISR